MGEWGVRCAVVCTTCACMCVYACANVSEIVYECGSVSPAVTQSAAAACSVPLPPLLSDARRRELWMCSKW